MRNILYCLVVLWTLSSCSPELSPSDSEDGDAYLFVGNSLSYANDMPGILIEIAEAYDIKMGADCLCKPNYAIVDHWNEAELKVLLAAKDYTQVVLQQGPSSQAFGRSVLLEYGPKINSLAAEHEAKTAFYMVWPAKVYYATFQGVIDNYTEAARVSNADLFPAGQVWKDYIAATGDESLYGVDEFHPSRKGSFLAAWVIFRFLYPDIDTEMLPDFTQYISTEDFKKLNELISIPD